MKLIVGLGNPGVKYRNSRHNVGFVALDKLAEGGDWESKFEAEICKKGEVVLVKPQAFMNRSGESVAKIINFYKADLNDLFVIHDDLDIKLGEYKIQKGIGPKVHNGLISIEEQLGKKDFWRVRVGVDNRSKEFRVLGEGYVLDDFGKDERLALDSVIDKVVNELRLLLR